MELVKYHGFFSRDIFLFAALQWCYGFLCTFVHISNTQNIVP
nr:MAG TPA: hypothetical protein [Caudoviricetes sp.]